MLLANEAEGNRPWLGTFCEVAIYDVALTAAQVGDAFADDCVVGANTNPTVDALGNQSSTEGDDVMALAVVDAADADGDTLTYDATGLPDGLAIDPTSGLVSGTITQTAAADAPYAVEVTVDDGRGGIVSADPFSWDVAEDNVTPVLDGIGNLLSSQGVELSFAFTASDGDGDMLTFSATGLPPGVTLAPDGAVGGTPTEPGTFEDVTVEVSDGKGGSDSEAFDWTIVEANEPPIVDDVADQESAEGDQVELTVTASDPNDGDVVTFDATGLPAMLDIDGDTGAITGTIGQQAAAGSPYTVEVTATDAFDASDTTTFAWTVDAVNVAPDVIAPAAQSSQEGDDVSLAVDATDVDGDTLAFDATGLPDVLAIDPATGVITGTVASDAAAGSPYAVEVTVDDGNDVATATFSWTVTEVTGPSRSCTTTSRRAPGPRSGTPAPGRRWTSPSRTRGT